MSETSRYTAPYLAAAPQNDTGDTKRPGKPHHHSKPQPTHFLCFPLVTDDSVTQLAHSLAYFRSVTTPLPESDPNATPEPENWPETGTPTAVDSAERDSTRHEENAETNQTLRLLPESAHRPPGTFHLTLGTMNLSKQEDVDTALALLQDIDFLALLNDAESGDSTIKHVKNQQRDPSKENLPAATTTAAATTTDLLSSPLQSVKSLSRAISPTPTTSKVQDPPTPPLTISLHSLGVFPNPSSARVFYAKPHDPSNRLQTFGNLVRRRFREAGLITETRPLVLHATVANLTYVRGKEKASTRLGGSGGRGRGRGGGRGGRGEGTVDAREILETFKEEIWAEDIPVSSIRICKMGAEACDIPGWGLEYKAVAERQF